MKDAINIINSLHICDEEYVVLACSYGPDSMVLLDILINSNINIVVAHINHKLRKESDKELLDLKKYCTEINIIFESAVIERYFNGNKEEFARKFRYNFFEEIVSKYQSKYLFTAHHGDDLVETVLMRLIRGASFKGYSGFRTVTTTNKYTLVRPLIFYTKEEILKYTNDNGIAYAIDQSNFNKKYTRNKIRHNILPIMKSINPKVHQKFLKFKQLINEYNDYFNEEVTILYSRLYQNNRLDINDFTLIPSLIQRLLIERIIMSIYQDSITLINDKHVEMILNLFNKESKNMFISLPKNLKVSKFYNIIEFSFGIEKTEPYDIILEKEHILPVGKIIKLDFDENEKDISNYILRLDSTTIKLPLHIRNQKSGDRIKLKNTHGTQKIKQVFINAKIPRVMRDKYPLVTDNEESILWVPGVKKSNFDKQTHERYDIILKYIQEGEKYEK